MTIVDPSVISRKMPAGPRLRYRTGLKQPNAPTKTLVHSSYQATPKSCGCRATYHTPLTVEKNPVTRLRASVRGNIGNTTAGRFLRVTVRGFCYRPLPLGNRENLTKATAGHTATKGIVPHDLG